MFMKGWNTKYFWHWIKILRFLTSSSNVEYLVLVFNLNYEEELQKWALNVFSIAMIMLSVLEIP